VNHNTWNYLFYIYYLREKKSTDYDGIESSVWESIRRDDIFWVPFERSLQLNSKVEPDGLERKTKDLVGRIVQVTGENLDCLAEEHARLD
jgi:hypothetical protein